LGFCGAPRFDRYFLFSFFSFYKENNSKKKGDLEKKHKNRVGAVLYSSIGERDGTRQLGEKGKAKGKWDIVNYTLHGCEEGGFNTAQASREGGRNRGSKEEMEEERATKMKRNMVNI
jgi:hypothetical protein